MKKQNKKGFTLIELLAVIVVLLIISTIAVSSINAAIERNKVKQDAAKKTVLESVAKLYYEEHKNTLGTATQYIKLQTLKDAGMLSEEEMKAASGKDFAGCIKVTSSGKTFKYTTSGCP